MSSKCSFKAQAATQKQRVGSIYTSCYAKTLNSASCSCCNKQSCSQVLNTVILHAVHTPTQTTFLFFTQLLTSAVFVYDTGMPRKQSCGKRYCRGWFWSPGCKSSVVPGQARSAALRGREVVTEEGMKVRGRFLWILPLLSLRTGGWERDRADHLFLTVFSVCNYLCPLLLLWYAQIWTELHYVLQLNSWLELEKMQLHLPQPLILRKISGAWEEIIFACVPLKLILVWQKKKKKKRPRIYARSEWTWTLFCMFWKETREKGSLKKTSMFARM